MFCFFPCDSIIHLFCYFFSVHFKLKKKKNKKSLFNQIFLLCVCFCFFLIFHHFNFLSLSRYIDYFSYIHTHTHTCWWFMACLFFYILQHWTTTKHSYIHSKSVVFDVFENFQPKISPSHSNSSWMIYTIKLYHHHHHHRQQEKSKATGPYIFVGCYNGVANKHWRFFFYFFSWWWWLSTIMIWCDRYIHTHTWICSS